MNTVQLECFLAVADHLNFARAAERLHISQPAVTHQIRSLESELNVQLFRRTTRAVELTDTGWNFLADAETILKMMHGAASRISESEQTAIHYFGIGAHRLLEPRFLPPLLSELTQSCPSVHPLVKLLPHPVLENMLSEESIEVLFGFQEAQPVKKPLIFQELGEFPTACVISPHHPLASHTLLTLEQLREGPIILSNPRRSFTMLGDIQNQVAGLRSPSQIYFSDDVESAMTLVHADLGFLLIPDLPMARDPDLLYIPVADAPTLTYGLYYKAHRMNSVLKTFVKKTRSYFSHYESHKTLNGESA